MLRAALGETGASPLKILCLGAHSDDVEIGCGATLLRFFGERPCSVEWCVFAASPEREKEARASAGAFLAGAAQKNVTVHAFRESYFPYVAAEIKDAFEALKQRIAPPDIVFSHHRHDLHQDHRVVAELTWNTFRNHVVLEYEIAKYEGDLGAPNVFVPVPRAVAERKVELLVTHFPSQKTRTWFHPDTFHGLMTLRGVECNAPEGRAEAFHARKLAL